MEKYCLHKKYLVFCFLICFIFIFSCQEKLPTVIVENINKLPETVDFNFHVKPILSDKCFACHGPDSKKRKANLRLDIDKRAISKTNEETLTIKDIKSSLIDRLTSDDPAMKMPPPDFHLSLDNKEIATIIKWIGQGAEYHPHWSFSTPVVKQLTSEDKSQWSGNGIDYFIKKKLEKIGVNPAIKASPQTLIRRLSFSLKGLPPSLIEVDKFINSPSSGAYKSLIDKYLNSPRYGELMANIWMDVARYADSDGYLDDKHRDFSPWRDWVIKAFNDNMTYDKFVTHQLAGDLIKDADQESIKATAFNRLHKKNSEAGIIFEEYRSEYVADRTITFGSAFLGMTLECARCHDHKYDPISQKNFYELASFFNNTFEIGSAVYGPGQSPGPSLLLTSKKEQEVIKYIEEELESKQKEIKVEKKSPNKLFESWWSEPKKAISEIIKHTENGLVAYYPFDNFYPQANGKNFKSTAGLKGLKPASIKEPQVKKGWKNQGLFVNEFTEMALPKNVGRFDQTDPFSLSFSMFPDGQYEDAMVFGHCEQIRIGLKGYSLFLNKNKLKFIIARSWPQNAIEIETESTIPSGKWTSITITYDGKGLASGLNLFVNGEKAPVKRSGDQLYKSILFNPNIHTYGFDGFRIGPQHKFKTYLKGGFDELKIYSKVLTEIEIAYLNDETFFDRLKKEKVYVNFKPLFRDFFVENLDNKIIKLENDFNRLRKNLTKVIDPVPELMVMGDRSEARPTHVLNRGVYSEPREEVFPNTPEAILNFDSKLPKNRLGLAQWLFDKKNPLTARVFVNRIWQMHFGKGLTSTTDDLGSQGALPNYPELLDWLSVQFINSGWNIKQLHKLILLSETYQQSSKNSDRIMAQDPENNLLARGPYFRMSAEMIRDNALSISGLLVDKVGGKSVYPYQPDGLWDLSDKVWKYQYKHDKGEGLYRRSLYTFWKRSSPPPSMLIFDTPNRDACSVKRTLTSTPLQALVLLNDPQYIEVARVLAENILIQKSNNIQTALEIAFRKVIGRKPLTSELKSITNFYKDELTRFRLKPNNTLAYLKIGEKPLNKKINPYRTAAMAKVISGLLNTSEAIMIR